MKRTMNPDGPQRPSDGKAIEVTAAAWLAQRDDGLTPEEAERFAQWRRADPRHEAAVVRLERAWGAMQQLPELRPEAPLHAARSLRRPPATARRRVAFPTLAAAAAAAMIVVAAAGWLVLSGRAPGPTRQDYATTIDDYERATLPDGSVLQLNASSTVSMHFTPEERRVRLLQGEAHFTVARDEARPFVVEAGGVAVRALGTAFNVRLGQSDVEVLVTQGKVKVAKAVIPAPDPRALPGTGGNGDALPPEGAAYLAASERVRFPREPVVVTPPAVEKVAPEVVREALAWQEPRLRFDNTPLADVVAQFNRRNHVQIILADEKLATMPIGGSFRAENIEAFVHLIESDSNIVVERPDATRILLRFRE